MKIWYWGTAAAEGVPGLFCQCKVCNEAREKGGRYVRTRSQVVFDDCLMMDFNADTYMHSLKYGFDLTKIKDVIITHVHSDHYYPMDLHMRGKGFAPTLNQGVLTVHGPTDIISSFVHMSGDLNTSAKPDNAVVEQGRIAFNTLQPYETYKIGDYEITPMPALHGTKTPYVYAIKGDKSVLMLNDTGYPVEEVISFLRDSGMQFDVISYDCTYCAGDTLKDWGKTASHMGLVNIIALRDQLIKNGNVKDTTVHILTHFSHNGPDAGYGDMKKHACDNGFALAYDGYCIEI